mmetsp:Transcript_1811/g.1733  ORF Transcript_1811/g.1733 Transcript_1811/m.1733 type:complete len:289 (+) Transcript_1811:485-1351(+)
MEEAFLLHLLSHFLIRDKAKAEKLLQLESIRSYLLHKMLNYSEPVNKLLEQLIMNFQGKIRFKGILDAFISLALVLLKDARSPSLFQLFLVATLYYPQGTLRLADQSGLLTKLIEDLDQPSLYALKLMSQVPTCPFNEIQTTKIIASITPGVTKESLELLLKLSENPHLASQMLTLESFPGLFALLTEQVASSKDLERITTSVQILQNFFSQKPTAELLEKLLNGQLLMRLLTTAKEETNVKVTLRNLFLVQLLLRAHFSTLQDKDKIYQLLNEEVDCVEVLEALQEH